MQTKNVKLLAICGSLRKGSCNAGLVRALKEFGGNVDIEVADLSQIPLYNGDLDNATDTPASVRKLRQQIADADGIVFASPEYNYSMSGVLKNAIDWASRSTLGPQPFNGKPAGTIGAGGGAGTGRAQYHLRQSGVFLNLIFMNQPEFQCNLFAPPKKFDDNGNLIDSDSIKYLKAWLDAFTAFVIEHRDVRAALKKK